MTLEQAIQKAIDGGWKVPVGWRGWDKKVAIALAVLDSSFWQSIGKAMGWEARCRGGEGRNEVEAVTYWNLYDCYDGWLYYWHCFIDHLAEGKNSEEFFASLPDKAEEVKKTKE